jgi:hypothetical protein
VEKLYNNLVHAKLGERFALLHAAD